MSAAVPVHGVPVRARRDNSNITVSVYTNSQGEYSFPGWSDLSPGAYSVVVEVPDFRPAQHDVKLIAGKTTHVDLGLQPRQPSFSDATAAEIVAALPGTDDERFLLAQCNNCHSLQWALRSPHTKAEWVAIVRRMAGEKRALKNTYGTRSYDQKRFIEPLASFLAKVRGPGSSDKIPFQLRPRPTGEASTNLVVTEYAIPRGGEHELYLIRGDRRVAWPHDVLVDSEYVWYTDHFAYKLGRLDRKTGEVKEYPYTVPPGGGREGIVEPEGQERAGNPSGGAHDIAFDPEGNIIFGAGNTTGIFNPKTEQFKMWPSGDAMLGIDPAGQVWFFPGNGSLEKLDPKTGKVTSNPLPPNDGIYDLEVDSKGRSILNIFRNGKIGMFDQRSNEYAEFALPTPQSGPRRGDLDAQDRLWVGLFWAGRIARFDPNQGEIKEYPLVPNSKPFGPPFTAPYSTAVDDKNGFVWTSDFNSSRIFRFDMKTEQMTEIFPPAPYEIRDLTVEKGAARPTVWIPSYRAPSGIVKIQIR